MNSHEYANKLKEVADFLLSKDQFDVRNNKPEQSLWYWTDKEQFLAAVRALGAGRKQYGGVAGDEIYFTTGNELLTLTAQRSAVCRKVQEEKWECEPLLSQAEEAEIGV